MFFQNEEDLQVFNATGLLKGTPTVLLPGSGMDILRFPFSTLPHEGPFTFVMVARMIADKGVREYVAAAGQVARRHPDARFTMPRQTLLTAARQRIEAQFDERIVVEAALGLVQD
ncbi:hypothetical protein CEK62_04245 [Alcanivorax sp. N3-2A]|nr:hypothetical protein CEK62_04245 [Alcanivorax sp. N3-2A]